MKDLKFKKNPLKAVSDFKQHPLTAVPGGYTMLLEFSDGKREKHPRVKYPVKYVDKVATTCRTDGRTLMKATVVEKDRVIYEVK